MALLADEYPDLVAARKGSDTWKHRRDRFKKRNEELFNFNEEQQVKNVIGTLNRIFDRATVQISMKEEYLCDSLEMMYSMYKEMKQQQEEAKIEKLPVEENPFEQDKDEEINKMIRINAHLEEEVTKLREEKLALEEQLKQFTQAEQKEDIQQPVAGN